MGRAKTGRNSPLGIGSGLVLSMGLLGSLAPSAYPWGGEHQRISAVAMESLPRDEQEYFAPERSAIARIYCTFPDLNWPCYGQWGGGTGDPKAPRMPDTRRLWEISFYCQWDPILQKGKGYPHGPPQSYEAVKVFFLKAVDSLKQGRLEDGSRFLGVMLHYIQDSGSFPHIQPIHRPLHVGDWRAIRIEGYAPCVLGRAPEEAAKALSHRVEGLTCWTEERLAPLLASVGMPMAEAKRLASQELMPSAVVDAVGKLYREKPRQFDAAATECANQCARACADAIHSALAFAQKPRVEPGPNPSGINLVFNPSFESGGEDGVPAGWCVGWLDPLDRLGRAEWYRAGTHWESYVRTGRYSVLLLWSAKKGLEWQQTWPKAVKVRPGEKYCGSVWGKGASTTGASYLVLEFSDSDYQPVLRAKSGSLISDAGWQRLAVSAQVPETARWMRVILHCEANEGATWYDDAELTRVP